MSYCQFFFELIKYFFLLDLVLKFLTVSDPDEKLNIQRTLTEEMPLIKEIALSYKKVSDKAQQ